MQIEPKSVEIVLPVRNEEVVLESSVRRLHEFLETTVMDSWLITIADNGSTDRTLEIAHRLEAELTGVRVFHVPEAGRGRALTLTWLESKAGRLAYMDIDLSTDLEAFPALLDALDAGADIVAGTRLGPGALTTRSLKRETLSRCFVLLTNAIFHTSLRDTQCGFKAMTRASALKLLPLVKDTGWFWDTELLLLATKGGWNVSFVAVRWVEDPDSRVDIVSTVWRDLKGLVRMRFFDWLQATKIVRLTRPGNTQSPALLP